jgi:hypothetical protein
MLTSGPALLIATALAGVIGAVHFAPRASVTPVGTVRQFLDAAVVDNDGETACDYLSTGARIDVERGGATCESFFGGASFDGVSSYAQLSGLRYSVSSEGHDPVVAVGGRRFVLQPANSLESAENQAPPTGWRIASSTAFLG